MRSLSASSSQLPIGAAIIATIGFVACSAPAQPSIRIDGSSTVILVTQAVQDAFEKSEKEQKRTVRLTIGTSGTGGGFKKFARGEIDVVNASRPILAKEMEEAKKNGIEFIELPIGFDALTVVVNTQNTFVKQFTIPELKKMWSPESQGKISSWKQVNDTWPDQPFRLYGAGSDSGTFDYFTEAVNGKAKSSRTDYSASENDNMLVRGVTSDANAIGYFGYAYFKSNSDKLRAVPIVNPKGDAVLPSPETVKDGTYAPLARPMFIYVNKKSLKRPEVKRFVDFYLTQGSDLVESVNFIALPPVSYEKALERVKNGDTGTAFGGHSEAGLHIDELFNRPLKQTPDPIKPDAPKPDAPK